MGKGRIVRDIAQEDKNRAIRLAFRMFGIDSSAEDGGPGSGNFGHKGRPGKVGGSQRGGGGQYRGGRADIGYFNSRKDWLNGLSGDKQSEAIGALKDFKSKLDHNLKAKNLIEKRWKEGMITESEKEEMLKNKKLDNLREDMTPEEFVMRNGDASETHYLLSLAKRARNWDKYKDRLVDDNLSEDEKKLYNAIVKNQYKDGIWADSDRWQGKLAIEQLEAKSMGLVDFDVDVPDEIHYRLGTKERPEPPKPEGPDYSWIDNIDSFGKDSLNTASSYMGSAIGEHPSYIHRWTKEEFIEQNQKFVDKLANGLMSPNEVSYYGVNAIQRLRGSMGESAGIYSHTPMQYEKKHFDRLTDDEKKELLEITNRYATADDFAPQWKTNVEDLTLEDFLKAESAMKHSTPRKKEERLTMQKYLQLQDKMLTGAEPISKEEIERREKEKEKERESEQSEFEKARLEKLATSPEIQQDREEAKKIRERREKGEKIRDGGGRYARDVGEGFYENCAAGIDRCGNVDVQVAWDLYHGEIKVNKATSGGSYFSPSSGEITYNMEKTEKGSSIHTPYETAYHEVAHAIDQMAAKRFWYIGRYDKYGNEANCFSYFWNNGEFRDTIEQEAKAFIDKIGGEGKKEFDSLVSSGNLDELARKFYESADWSERRDISQGKTAPKWTVTRKRECVVKWLKSQKSLAKGMINDVIQGATRSKIYTGCGHDKSYYTGRGAQENMATECFAELYAATIANPDELELMKQHFPKTVECFGRMMKDIAERG